MIRVEFPRPTELACQATIVAAARMAGWLVHAERASLTQTGRWATAIQGDRGWPDIVLARAGVLLMVELKRAPNRVEPEQVKWHTALRLVPGVITGVLWVPDQQEQFIAAITAPAWQTRRSEYLELLS